MKSVRTREEALDDLRRRVGASAEAAERKLNEMIRENKYLDFQTATLSNLRGEMVALDAEILREETELGDYKRKCTSDWMSLKFAGLVECCEKGVVRASLHNVYLFLTNDFSRSRVTLENRSYRQVGTIIHSHHLTSRHSSSLRTSRNLVSRVRITTPTVV